MFEQDYIMRQIQDLAKAIVKMFFNVNVESSAMEVIKRICKQKKRRWSFCDSAITKTSDMLRENYPI